jgi:hypothetical protein
MVNKILYFLVLVVIIISIINITVTFMKFSEFKESMTGYAANLGYVNISIFSSVIINVSQDKTFWGNGVVNASFSNNATLMTNKNESGIVIGGNWSNNVQALVLQNLGSVNVSLNITSDYDNTDYLIGCSQQRKQFMYSFSNKDSYACNYSLQTQEFVWYNVSKEQRIICDKLRFGSDYREIFIDSLIMIADDCPPQDRVITFTFVGTAIND